MEVGTRNCGLPNHRFGFRPLPSAPARFGCSNDCPWSSKSRTGGDHAPFDRHDTRSNGTHEWKPAGRFATSWGREDRDNRRVESAASRTIVLAWNRPRPDEFRTEGNKVIDER